MKRKIILGLLLLIVVAGIIGYMVVFKSRADIVNDKPDMAVTVPELIAAFEKDTAATSKQFIEKVVQVTGLVKRIDTSGAVILGEGNSPSEVVVAFDQKYHKKDYEQLKVGSQAVLQGVGSGYSISGSDPDDLLSGLGTTVQIRSAGVKANN
jgi:hypothetical protein